MALVTDYHIMVYGGPDGYQTNRAQIQLKGENGVLAWLRFNDPNMNFENDYMSNGIIRMFLPSTMFQPFLEIMRSEKEIKIHFLQNRGFLELG